MLISLGLCASMKAVLPTIADGGMAQDAYLEMIHTDTSHHRREALLELVSFFSEVN